MNKLTKIIAIDAVKHINDVSDDDEQAYIEESDLYHWFVDCISMSMYTQKESREIANILKETRIIGFSRWFA